MDTRDFPILEYDDSTEPVIQADYNILPEHESGTAYAVLCYFREVIDDVVAQHDAEIIFTMRGEVGVWPIYRIEHQGQPVMIMLAPVGAPMAAVALERLIALGARKIIACGGAGTLVSDRAVGHLVIPTSAVRDEGTSYHYLPPSREVAASPSGVAAIESVLKAHHVAYDLGKTWTTDGVFRETRARVNKRREEGCHVVEMEAATFFAVAQHHGVELAQILYCGDDLSGEDWDGRDWNTHTSIRERIFWLAVESVLQI